MSDKSSWDTFRKWRFFDIQPLILFHLLLALLALIALERHTNESKGWTQSRIDTFASFACQTADNCGKSYSLIPWPPNSMLCRFCGLASLRKRKLNIYIGGREQGNVFKTLEKQISLPSSSTRLPLFWALNSQTIIIKHDLNFLFWKFTSLLL